MGQVGLTNRQSLLYNLRAAAQISPTTRRSGARSRESTAAALSSQQFLPERYCLEDERAAFLSLGDNRSRSLRKSSTSCAGARAITGS